jgi:hypothetical protein
MCGSGFALPEALGFFPGLRPMSAKISIYASETITFNGKFHISGDSSLNFCSSSSKVEVLYQPQRGGTDHHEIQKTA